MAEDNLGSGPHPVKSLRALRTLIEQDARNIRDPVATAAEAVRIGEEAANLLAPVRNLDTMSGELVDTLRASLTLIQAMSGELTRLRGASREQPVSPTDHAPPLAPDGRAPGPESARKPASGPRPD